MRIYRATLKDNLARVCTMIQPKLWGEDNEMSAYEPALLKKFLEAGNYLVLAYEDDKIVSAATAYPMNHPAKDGNSLYVHELDTHPDFRRRGIAQAIMEDLITLASELGVSELWVCADQDNKAANALYKKLGPYEIDPSVTYAYKTK